MSSDKQFTAIGPAPIGFQTTGAKIDIGAAFDGSNAGVVGHCNNGTGVEGTSRRGTGVEGTSERGVGVSGNGNLGMFGVGKSAGMLGVNQGAVGSGLCGVHTVSLNLDSPVTPEIHPQMGAPGAGVFGFSDGGIGVFGNSQESSGVEGHSLGGDGVVGRCDVEGKSGIFGFNSSERGVSFGVFGQCDSAQGAGVSGRNDSNGDAVSGFSPKGVGVRGTSKGNDGVVGHSEAVGNSGVFGENTSKPNPNIGGPGSTEVFGVTGRANASAGIGVSGVSAKGIGVSGNGGTYGAKLQGGRAPLRLMPSATKGAPKTGFHQRGEFFVDTQGSLFYCNGDGTPGNWKRVRLEDA